MALPPSLAPWIPVLVALIAAAVSLFGVFLSGRLALSRERETLAHKDSREREEKRILNERHAAYLAGVVAGPLENLSSACEAVAFDHGREDESGYTYSTTETPTFDPEKYQVEWSVLPGSLMFSLLDLPHKIRQAHTIIDGSAEHSTPPDFPEFFEQRRYQFAKIGIESAHIAAELRRYAGIDPRPENPEWNSIEQMEGVIAEIERRWAAPETLPFLPPVTAN